MIVLRHEVGEALDGLLVRLRRLGVNVSDDLPLGEVMRAAVEEGVRVRIVAPPRPRLAVAHRDDKPPNLPEFKLVDRPGDAASSRIEWSLLGPPWPWPELEQLEPECSPEPRSVHEEAPDVHEPPQFEVDPEPTAAPEPDPDDYSAPIVVPARCRETDAGEQCDPPVPEALVAATLPPWRCPACLSDDVFVVDSRPLPDSTRRRRSCRACEHRFTTVETVVP